jgi:HEAT repeat protein
VVWEAFLETDFARMSLCLGLVRLGFDRSPGDEAGPLTPSLRPLNELSRQARRRAIVYLAGYEGKIVGSEALLTALRDDEDKNVRDEARRALEAIRSSSFTKLLKAPKDADPAKRAEALWDMVRDGSAARVVTPFLLASLKDEAPKVRWMATNVLGGMDVEAERVVPELIKAVRDSDPGVRQVAVNSLARLGKASKPAVPVLLEALKGKDTDLRHWAAAALGAIGPVDERIVPALTEALRDIHARCMAAASLGNIGPQAREAVPVLLDMLDAPVSGKPPDVEKCIRQSIVWAMGRLGPEAKSCVPRLIKLVEDPNTESGLRQTAIRALGHLGSTAREAIPVLEARSNDPRDPGVSEVALHALRQIQGKEEE